MDIDNAVYILEPHGPDHEVIPVANLWDAISRSPFYQVNEPCDLYEELQSALASGEQLFSMLLAPASEEIGFDDETESNFGIELLVSPDNPNYPWPSKAHYITALLFSSPRLPFSEAQKKAVLSWAKELGAHNVPSLYTLNRLQESVRTLVSNPTEKITARSGNIFYLNDVGKAIAKDYANPLTRFVMQDYPEDGGKGMSQVFNGEKMLFEHPSPPAAKVNGEIYFVNELLQDASGDYFTLERFFLASYTSTNDSADKQLHALGRAVQRTQSSNKYAKLVPNPLCAKSQGCMVYSVPLIIFMDDISGNISKQWNKHHAIYMSNANLPRKMLEKEFCIRFVTSSPHAAPMEMISAMQESISEAAESGVFTWDCKYEEEVMLELYGLFLGGDNPMQAEECSHAGLHCNYFCRTCEVGGTKEYKESDEGYKSIFMPGKLRTPAGTAEEVRAQFSSALSSGTTEKIKKSVASSGVKDTTTGYILGTVVELGKKLRKRGAGVQAKSETEDAINPLLGMEGFNVHQDTPTEILHTVLLGIVKYFWGQSVYLLEKAKLLDVFQMCLDSIEKAGLNAPCLNAEYICHYKGGLIGKHFKSLAQVMPFLIQDLLPRTVLDGWTCIGELVVYVWHTEIDDIEIYLTKLSRTIEDFLNVTAKCAPSILISKPKFHFLVHLPAYIRRFGPAILFSTERYESFNHVFQLACIHSNRQGPSQDTCKVFARQDIIKHIATSGYWFDSVRKKWVRAGDAVVNYLDEHPEQARLLGIHLQEPPVTGNVFIEYPASWIVMSITKGTGQLKKVATEDGRPVAAKPVLWTATRCAKALKLSQPACNAQYRQGISLILGNGKKACLEGDIIFHDSSTSHSAIGHIREILISDSHKVVEHVAVQKFAFGPVLHPLLHLPTLKLTEHEIVISPQEIVCVVNVQHDCVKSQCTETNQCHIHQERMETARTKSVIQHKSSLFYLLNAYSIHNYAQIRSVIPPSLRETSLRVDNAAEVRLVAARQIREKKAAKKSGEAPDTEPLSALRNDIAGVPAVFDRPAAKRTKKTQKAKEKAPPPRTNPRQPTFTQAAASSSSHLPTSPFSSLAIKLTFHGIADVSWAIWCPAISVLFGASSSKSLPHPPPSPAPFTTTVIWTAASLATFRASNDLAYLAPSGSTSRPVQ
ncbi:hypothetical protein F4604DRAFT_1883535 [Suillus subluteus]|nr:hypothetical protein F4604DRAFT_1883535 [Suillus subluteus]